MTDQVQMVPGTEIPLQDFAQNFADRIVIEDGKEHDVTDAEAWAREELGQEATEEQRDAVLPHIVERLKTRVQEANNQTEVPKNENAPESSQEAHTEELDQTGTDVQVEG